MDKEEIVASLQDLPDNEFLALLQEVFQVRKPWPTEADFHRNHYFLGIADQLLKSKHWTIERWSPWETSAVAYVDQEHYGSEGFGVDGDFGQGGTCGSCGTHVWSHVKNGICPVCGTPVFMT